VLQGPNAPQLYFLITNEEGDEEVVDMISNRRETEE
jgi:hypothetical protein